jgi:CheY-like chemotaxis protein
MLAYSGKGRFLIQALDLNQAIEEISHLLQASISETAIISYNLYPDLPAIEADASQIHQVILNLVTNASEAIGDTSGVITITTALIDCDAQYLAETFLDDGLEQGAYVYLEVADTGCGMDKETQDKIFDPFYTTKFTGRGLGLAAVLGIVRGHKGAIEVNSEPGRGTTFRILFPCSHKEAVKASKEALNIESFQGKGKGLAINKVLVIDDEEGIRMVAQRTLERAGLQVITASDGREGLKVFEETKDELSLVILDLTMPHLSGEEVLVKMRQINPDVPVILTSGYNEQEISTRFEGQELAGFIQKPFRPTVLLAMVERVLNRTMNDE